MDFFVREKRSKDDVDIFSEGFYFEFWLQYYFSYFLFICYYVYTYIPTSSFQIVYLPNLRNRFMNNDRILLLEILYSNFKVALCSVRPIVLILKCFAFISTRQYRKLLEQYTALIILISICIRCISKQEIPKYLCIQVFYLENPI